MSTPSISSGPKAGGSRVLNAPESPAPPRQAPLELEAERLPGEPLAPSPRRRWDDDVGPSARGGGPKLPRWLQDPSLSARETTAYREAAQCLGLEVGHWARQVLNKAAHGVLAISGKTPLWTPAVVPPPGRPGPGAR